MTVSNDDLRNLRTLAEKATPGPWHLTGIPDVVDILSVGNRLICSPCKMGDAAFIAANDPQTVMAYIDEIMRFRHGMNELDKRLDVLVEYICKHAVSCATCPLRGKECPEKENVNE